LLLLVTTASALELRVTVTPNQIAPGDTAVFNLEMVGDAIPVVDSVVFTSSADFQLEESGRSQGLSIINGSPSASLMLQFLVQFRRNLRPGNYRLPDGVVTVGGKPFSFRGPELRIIEPVAGDSPVEFLQIVDNLSPFEGEQVLYRCEILAKTEISNAVLENTNLEGFFREEFPTDKQTSRVISGSRAKVFSFREAIYPSRSGELEVPPRGLAGKIKKRGKRRGWGSGPDMFDDLWSSFVDEFTFESRRFVAPALKLNVRPLPPGPKGYVPVGKTSFEAGIEKTQLRSAESVKLVVTVSSQGNLRPLNFVLTPPADIKSYPEKPELETEVEGDRIIQRKTFSFNLVPEFGGEFELSGLGVTYFDTESEQYQVAQAAPIKLTVLGEKRVDQPDSVVVRTEERGPLPELFGREVLDSGVTLSRSRMLLLLALILSVPFLKLLMRGGQKAQSPESELSRLSRREEFTEEELKRIKVLVAELAPARVREIDKILYGGGSDSSGIKDILRGILNG
jgi:hypothetical protein